MSRPVHILFAAQDEDTRVLINTLLELSGYIVSLAGTAAEALNMAKTGVFSLYLLNDWLPDGTGVELCRQLRGLDPATPIVFYSAQGFEESRQRAMRAGAQEYLMKPDGIYEIEQAVARLLTQSPLG